MDLLQEMFPNIDNDQIKQICAKHQNVNLAIEKLLCYVQSEDDKQVAEQLAQNFAETDNTPKCTKNPSCYQLFVVDQVTARKE